MPAGIDVRQHAGHRSMLAFAAVRTAFSRLDYQPGSLQQQLDARLAVRDAVLFAKLFTKVPHVEVETSFAIQAQHLFGHAPRHTLGAAPPWRVM
jgi:hypothetical protein